MEVKITKSGDSRPKGYTQKLGCGDLPFSARATRQTIHALVRQSALPTMTAATACQNSRLVKSCSPISDCGGFGPASVRLPFAAPDVGNMPVREAVGSADVDLVVCYRPVVRVEKRDLPVGGLSGSSDLGFVILAFGNSKNRPHYSARSILMLRLAKSVVLRTRLPGRHCSLLFRGKNAALHSLYSLGRVLFPHLGRGHSGPAFGGRPKTAGSLPAFGEVGKSVASVCFDNGDLKPECLGFRKPLVYDVNGPAVLGCNVVPECGTSRCVPSPTSGSFADVKNISIAFSAMFVYVEMALRFFHVESCSTESEGVQ